MKKVLILVYSAFFVILLANLIYYKNLYNKQINYITTLLSRQVQIVGMSVDQTNNQFLSDLNEISFSGDLSEFFYNSGSPAKEKIKNFFSKYQDFITGIKLYDNKKNEFTLKRDEPGVGWLEQQFILHSQGEIYSMEQLVQENRKFDYYLPVLKDNVSVGNIVVTVDYQKYFHEIFSAFNLKDYQWQWVISDSGEIIYDNVDRKISYEQIDQIISALESGSVDNMIHKAKIEGKENEIISSYYSTQLLQRNLGIIFSAPTDFFQKYIIRNSIFIVTGTLLLIQLIIFLFWKYLKSQKTENKRLSDSEKMLFKLIEDLPVGLIIYNRNREIMKASNMAASQYSYPGEAAMRGKIYPETSLAEISDYFSKNLGGTFNPGQFVIIKKEAGEIVLCRSSIPVTFMGEEANMEILADVTMLESARKKEAQANIAKSEFLSRMSYEIRTPLNGIIGMTDILNKNDLSGEVKEIVGPLRRSTELLLSIINDILDFSKIEAGEMILNEVPFNLREEITHCTDLAKTSISEKDVIFSSIVDENTPKSIIADPFRLRQILTNLINHSVVSTEKGEIKLSCKQKKNKEGVIVLEFELSDTGLSYDKANLNKIFGDIVNIDSKAVKNNDESGFGTILARQLVELMGGELTAESPSGLAGEKGTKIVFTIQAYSNDRITKSFNQEKISSFDKIKTLVITGPLGSDEDIPGLLHKLDLNVSVTAFQKSTIGQIKANLNSPGDKYKLIIIIDDKDFNGFEAARTISENNLSGNVALLMISSNDQKGNYMKCITLGIDQYMVRPFVISDLAGAIENCFPFIENGLSSFNRGNIRDDVRILVVEDNKMNQKVIGTMLKTLDYTCDFAEDGYDGLLQAKNKKYDLIFMDLILPEMDGFDSARKILNFDKSVLIIAFTADNMPNTRKKAELAGIVDFIAKPVKLEDLKILFAKYFKKK